MPNQIDNGSIHLLPLLSQKKSKINYNFYANKKFFFLRFSAAIFPHKRKCKSDFIIRSDESVKLFYDQIEHVENIKNKKLIISTICSSMFLVCLCACVSHIHSYAYLTMREYRLFCLKTVKRLCIFIVKCQTLAG